MIVVVTNCDNCPLCSEGVFCQHPDKPEGESQIWEANGEAVFGENGDWHPPWCPLRGNKLIIELVKP